MQTIWNVIGTSVTGTKHKAANQPCQDFHTCTLMENGILLIVATDGAQTAQYAEKASRHAAETAFDTLHDQLVNHIPENADQWGTLMRDSFAVTHKKIRDLAHWEDAHPKDFACTLLIVIADHEWLVTGQVGDGDVIAQTENGELHTVTTHTPGDGAGNKDYLTDKNAPDIFDVSIFEQDRNTPINAIALMTNAVAEVALNNGQPHAPFFAPMFSFPQQISDPQTAITELTGFLNSPGINARTDDDKTLVLAVRPE